MKKIGLILLLLVILGGWTVNDLEAGQWCWQLADSNLYMKLSFAKNDPSYPFWTLSGMVYEPGISLEPVSGTMVKNADGTRRLLTLTMTNADGISWLMYADIDAQTKSGPMIGYSPNYDSYDPAHTLSKVPCSSLPTP